MYNKRVKQRRGWQIGLGAAFLLAVSIMLVQARPSLAADSTWTAKYWDNKNLAGDPVIVRQENNIDHDWGQGAPNSITSDQFSARWKKTINFAEGAYRFDATMDDGMRIYLDGNIILDSWTDSQVHSMSATVNISSGDHVVKVEYYDAGGAAVAKMTITTVSTAVTEWRGEYYNNKDLSGTPALVRNDAHIDFNWGNGSPASGINADNFSVRWTRSIYFNPGRYRFTANTDDGVRLWVNDQQIINSWSDHQPQDINAEINLPGGNAVVRMEYYENTGGARAILTRTQIGTTPSPTPIPVTTGTATINIYRLNIRQGPGTNFGIITTLNRGDVLSLAGYRNAAATWIKIVLPNGTQGWVSAIYVITSVPIVNLTVENNPTPTTPAPAPAPTGATARVTAFYLNVRQGPSVTYSVITTVSLNQVYALAGVRNSAGTWVKIVLANGTQGWVNAYYVATSVPVSGLPVGN
jgi:uncharacterized protein YraI